MEQSALESTSLLSSAHPSFGSGTSAQQITLTWENVTYEVRQKKSLFSGEYDKIQILKGISGYVRPGEMLGIIGSSGSGKTTLMDILAGRKKGGKVGGSVLVNGNKITEQFKSISGYVTQEDLLLGTQTVTESLQFYANLRLPPSVSRAEKAQKVDSVLKVLSLEKVRSSRIGTSERRGISGGEKKRLSIGCELITDPGVLFCDEPTTGLDSFNAMSVMTHLRELADQGQTVVCTIHQPRSSIFDLFDKVLLVSQGNPVFFGSKEEALSYFEHHLFSPCKPFNNPADHMMDVIVSSEKRHLQSAAAEDRIAFSAEINAKEDNLWELYERWKTSHFQKDIISDIEGIKAKFGAGEQRRSRWKKSIYATNWFRQTGVLSYRTFTNWARNPMSTYASLFQTLFMSLLVGSIYFQIKSNQGSIQDRVGSLFFIITGQAFSMIRSLNTFIGERELFLKERASGCYRTSAYFMSKSIVEAPMLLLFPLLYCVVAYFMVGYQQSLEKFGIFIGAVVLFVAVASSLYLTIGSVTSSLDVANIIAPIVTVLFLLFGGFYVNMNNVPVYYQWLPYVSFFKYCYEILIVNEFEGLEFSCDAGEQCPISDGKTQIKLLGMEDVSISENFLILGAMLVVYRILSYICLRTFHGEKR